jgi:hypothetical protein
MWTMVPGWRFSVNQEGLIKGPSGRILAPMASNTGHLYVLYRDGGRGGKQRKLYVHRAVLMAFVGPCPEGHEARHLNGEPNDNRLSNLCWDTR